jgi:hypothetical protein
LCSGYHTKYPSIQLHTLTLGTCKIIECRMMSSGMLRHMALVRTDVSECLSASIIKVTRIGELGTVLAITSNRRTRFFIVTGVKTSHFTFH